VIRQPLRRRSKLTKPRRKANPKAPRQGVLHLAPEIRIEGCEEVALGFSPEQVKVEVLRCLQCRDPKCIEACPLHIDIKSFIALVGDGDFEAAFAKISEENPFPASAGGVPARALLREGVTVGDGVRFACIDGPEFDAHQVDFEELTRRSHAYLGQERVAREGHICRIGLE
jgi:Dihydroprymidine dehydrogenase domain II, 4Fe-4S cluster